MRYFFIFGMEKSHRPYIYMLISYFFYSVSIAFVSFVVGMGVSSRVINTRFYTRLSNLNVVKNERINQMIGLGIVKWVVRNTFFKRFNPHLKIEKRLSATDLRQLRAVMNKSEIDHLFAFVFLILVVLGLLIGQQVQFGLVLFVVNVLMNFYPLLLQQQNKRRIDAILMKHA